MTLNQLALIAAAEAEARYDGYDGLVSFSKTMRERYIDRTGAAIRAYQANSIPLVTSLDAETFAELEIELRKPSGIILPVECEGWQDISTAPNERGAKILGWCVFPAGAEVRLCQNAPAYMAPPGTVRWEAYGLAQDVTHWMPLPKPPESSGQNLADATPSNPPSPEAP